MHGERENTILFKIVFEAKYFILIFTFFFKLAILYHTFQNLWYFSYRAWLHSKYNQINTFTSTKYDSFYFLRKLIEIHSSVEIDRNEILIDINWLKPSGTLQKSWTARNNHDDISDSNSLKRQLGCFFIWRTYAH